jgi:hypothetical protein
MRWIILKCGRFVRSVYYNVHRKRFNQLKFKYISKEKIKVVFLSPDPAVFCLDKLYSFMKESDIFDPVIGVFPYEHMAIKTYSDRVKEAYMFFIDKGYKVEKLYDQEYKPISLKTLNPDIVFFCFTHALSRTASLFIEAKDAIRCHISYGTFLSNLQIAQFNMPYHNQYDALFWESFLSLELSKKYADDKGRRSYFLGYPKFDTVFYDKYPVRDVWKPQHTKKKRIIWAPHHSIEKDQDHYGFSCFLQLAEFMFAIAYKYKDSIQIAFKPHPLLFDHVLMENIWNKNEIDSYCKKWEGLDNGQYEPVEYMDLFLTSDAMILDSVSFMCEYSVLNKPALFTVRDETIQNKFNEFGSRVFNEILYRANNLEKDIVSFIETVVLGENDSLKNTREQFIKNYLLPPNNKTAQENIFDFICEEIQK